MGYHGIFSVEIFSCLFWEVKIQLVFLPLKELSNNDSMRYIKTIKKESGG